jgi:hypothetical protein
MFQESAHNLLLFSHSKEKMKVLLDVIISFLNCGRITFNLDNFKLIINNPINKIIPELTFKNKRNEKEFLKNDCLFLLLKECEFIHSNSRCIVIYIILMFSFPLTINWTIIRWEYIFPYKVRQTSVLLKTSNLSKYPNIITIQHHFIWSFIIIWCWSSLTKNLSFLHMHSQNHIGTEVIWEYPIIIMTFNSFWILISFVFWENIRWFLTLKSCTLMYISFSINGTRQNFFQGKLVQKYIFCKMLNSIDFFSELEFWFYLLLNRLNTIETIQQQTTLFGKQKNFNT